MRRRRPCCGCPGRSRVKAGAGGPGRGAEGGGRAGGSAALIGVRGAATGGSEDVRLQSGLRGARRQRRRGHGGRSSGSSGCCVRRCLQGAPVRPGEAQASAAGGAGRGAGRAEATKGRAEPKEQAEPEKGLGRRGRRAWPARCTRRCSHWSLGDQQQCADLAATRRRCACVPYVGQVWKAAREIPASRTQKRKAGPTC